MWDIHHEMIDHMPSPSTIPNPQVDLKLVVPTVYERAVLLMVETVEHFSSCMCLRSGNHTWCAEKSAYRDAFPGNKAYKHFPFVQGCPSHL